MATQSRKPVLKGDILSMHEREREQEEQRFAPQLVENPLEVVSSRADRTTPSIAVPSIQATPSIMERRDPMDDSNDLDEAPPPYSEFEGASRDAPQIAAIEYSCENSPQLVVAPEIDFEGLPQRNSMHQSERDADTILTRSTALGSPMEETLYPVPLRLRHSASNGSIPRRPLPQTATTSFSSAKAREAGFEIEQPPSLDRTATSSSSPSITILPSTDTLKHSREPGKVMAYLIPFPKPRLKGVKPEDIPERFLIYTPPLPPLSRPGPGEKESHWHKTQRLWQEDVRQATMKGASRVTWKGMKARTTSLINKGVSKTRSANVEFLDRVSGGALTEATQGFDEEGADTLKMTTTSTQDLSGISIQELPTSPSSTSSSHTHPPSTPSTIATSSTNYPSSVSSADREKVKAPKPTTIESLTLIYPPSLSLAPSQIRQEFVDTLERTRQVSRNKALVASALLPFAATIDACLIVTFGGLTSASSVYTYQNSRGAITSGKLTRGLSHTYEEEAEAQPETKGCTCGHHEGQFGCAETAPKTDKKGKKKKDDSGIAMSLLSSSALRAFTRYLELACLQRSFTMFPHIAPGPHDPSEDEILQAIGWAPTRRYGRDLELDGEGGMERLTSEEDEGWQWKEAREDVRSIVRKAAAEWGLGAQVTEAPGTTPTVEAVC
ncbi:hypothetical protein N0V90_005334 [Kalmusia sp. IMI 367209]|nr:hypothetical protein N0V90_005334 [Kalmusia sp. IMI 367209]